MSIAASSPLADDRTSPPNGWKRLSVPPSKQNHEHSPSRQARGSCARDLAGCQTPNPPKVSSGSRGCCTLASV
eukprot:7214844-Alexandrium_andersonii.AAC.1